MSNIFKYIFSSYLPAILISILFVIPLLNCTDLFNGIVSSKKYGFYYLMTILIIYNIFSYMFDKRVRRIYINKIDLTFLLLVTWNILSAFFSKDSYINDKTSELIFLAIFYFLIKGHLIDPDNQKSFLIISTFFLLSIAIIEVIVGVLQVYHVFPSNNPYFRVTGTFNNPVPYALLLTVTYAYALAVYSFNVLSYKPIKYLALASCVLILNIVPFTLNRASWIGIFSSTVLIGFYKLSQNKFTLKLNKWKKIGLATLIILFISISIPYLYNFKKGSSDGRLLVWKVCGTIIKEHPLIGIGYGRFRSEYNLYQANYFKDNHKNGEELLAGDTQVAFNDYLESLVESGILGFILFISLIYFVLNSFKQKQDLVNLFLWPLLIFFVLSFVSYPVNTLTTKILFLFFIASLSSFIVPIEISTMIGLHKWLVVILLVVVLPFAIMQIVKYDKYKIFLHASKASNAKEYEISEEYFRQGCKTLMHESYFSLKFAECLIENQKYREAQDVLNDAKEIVPDPELFLLMGKLYLRIYDIRKAERSFIEASSITPGRILPKYYLTKLYYDNNEYVKADSMVKRILIMPIKINSDTIQELIKEIKMMHQNHNKSNRLNMPGRGI